MSRDRSTSRRAARGFTLVELMTAIAVLAIVLAAAAPSMRAFATSQRAKTLSYDLVQDLIMARSEALKRNAVVTVTPGGGGWGDGWAVAVGGRTLVQRQPETTALVFDSAPAQISFNVFGRVAAPADPVRMTVRAADNAADVTKRCVELDPAGYARTKMGACT